VAEKRSGSLIRVVNLIFFGIGVAAFVWMIRKIGVADLEAMIASVGNWAIPIMATSVAAVFLNSAAIHVFMRPEQRMVSYWRVLAAQLSGQAVNSVTPTGTLGEVVKATLLVGHAPRYRAVSAVVAFNIANVFATVAFLMFAIVIALVDGDLPTRVEWILRIALLVMVVVTIGVVYMIRHGLIRSFAGAARGLRIVSAERREKIATRLESFDRQVRIFGSDREADYGAGLAFVAISRIIGWFDLWIILTALGYSQGFVITVIAAAAGMIISTVAAIIPLGIGASEGGQAGLFELLGPGAIVGLSVSLIRRLRTVAIAGLGLTVMLAVQLLDGFLYRRSRDRVIERVGQSGE
jgi:uncharacterized protein (TIRG00374 family)